MASKTRKLHVLVADNKTGAEQYAKGMRHALRSDHRPVKGRVKVGKTGGGKWCAFFQEERKR